ncbi:hypothetical protein Q5H92_15070 [Hymenobacter sp. M29]|uniref:Glycosyltransferase RgtA/B/C/D-like domain-containing protein n=1 Tax=Hymenobacter mellowenesis TaxID=3063995 RepID=A0ABT9AD04_9BACT|nr:hypothetical protein [Hymenobacter sp. M29]MDO7847689.1 hypothetical protein [Hymenobacter sp. M29]
MPRHSRFAIFLRVVLLPLGLIGSTVAGLGSYYETSDETALAWLFNGTLALKPVVSLPLYFHGYGHLLAAAYAAVPGVAWLGGLLGGLMAGATVLAFAVLDRILRPYLRPAPLAGVLMAFFAICWLEHWLLFSHVRVAVLLAAAALLFAAQRPGQRWALAVGLLGLGAGWLLRPGPAVLGLAAAVPGAIWLAGGWRRAVPVVAGGAALLVLATGAAAALQTPAQARAQARDGYLAPILDFEQLRPQPRTAADSLGTAAVSLWLLGDSTVVNETFCRRAYRFDAPAFWLRVAPAKLRLRAGLLLRDYFPVLLLLAGTAVVAGRGGRPRRGFWLVQVGFGGALALLAGVLKLPPRLALPILDCWLLANGAFLLARPADSRGAALLPAFSRKAGGLVAGLGLVVFGLYGLKTLHRRQVLRAERGRHEQALRAIGIGAGRLVVMAGTTDLFKSLSPFRADAATPASVLLLSGWPSHDASQAALRKALSGTTDQTECLRRLANRPVIGTDVPVAWVLTPETAAWLSRRTAFDGFQLLFSRQRPVLPAEADSVFWLYRAELQLKKM